MCGRADIRGHECAGQRALRAERERRRAAVTELAALRAENERLRGCMQRCRDAALAGDWNLAAACVDERAVENSAALKGAPHEP